MPHWLRDYEGGRGVAYLLAIVGAIAPTIIAMFLLSPSEFEDIDWTMLVLLSAAVGGMTTAICVLARAFHVVTDAMIEGAEGTQKYVNKLMLDSLTFGSIIAFMVGAVVLAYTAFTGMKFREFVCLSLLGAGLYLAYSFLSAVIRWNIDDKKKKRLLVGDSTEKPKPDEEEVP